MTRYFKQKIKQYRKVSFDKEAYIKKMYLDDDGNAVIKIKLKQISDAYSEFSIEGFSELTSDFTSYLDDIIYNFALKYPVIIEVFAENSTKEEKQQLEDKIMGHYGLVLEDKKQDLKINMIMLISLFVVGSGLLLFSYYLSSTDRGQYFVDFINIAGTFSLWEMVDLYLLDRKVKKVQELNAAQTASAKIVFKKPAI